MSKKHRRKKSIFLQIFSMFFALSWNIGKGIVYFYYIVFRAIFKAFTFLITLPFQATSPSESSFVSVKPSVRLEAKAVSNLYELSPVGFEQYVGKLFKAEGYKVTDTPASNDGGVDLFIENDKTFGIVQCKRYGGSVGVKIIRELYGTMLHEKANVAYLVTTGTFTSQAIDFAEGKPIELMDGEEIEIWRRKVESGLEKSKLRPYQKVATVEIDSSNIVLIMIFVLSIGAIGLFLLIINVL